MWLDRLNVDEFDDVCTEMESMHKSMKNAMEMVFSTSPLLALQTRGWASKSIHSTYLLRVSDLVAKSLAFIEVQEDLPCPWERPPSNPLTAWRLRPPGHHRYLERGVKRSRHRQPSFPNSTTRERSVQWWCCFELVRSVWGGSLHSFDHPAFRISHHSLVRCYKILFALLFHHLTRTQRPNILKTNSLVSNLL